MLRSLYIQNYMSATLFGIMVEDVGLAFSVAFVPGFAAALIAYAVVAAHAHQVGEGHHGNTAHDGAHPVSRDDA